MILKVSEPLLNNLNALEPFLITFILTCSASKFNVPTISPSTLNKSLSPFAKSASSASFTSPLGFAALK